MGELNLGLLEWGSYSASLFTVKMISPKVKYWLLNSNPDVSATDVQNKLVAKDNEIQSLHSKLTDTMVSKQQLEQRMLQLLEAEQKRASEKDSMQMQVQVVLLKCFKGLGFFLSVCVCGNTEISLKCCFSKAFPLNKGWKNSVCEVTPCVQCCEEVWGHLTPEEHLGQVRKRCWPHFPSCEMIHGLGNTLGEQPWTFDVCVISLLLASGGERQGGRNSWGLQGNQMDYGGAGNAFPWYRTGSGASTLTGWL